MNKPCSGNRNAKIQQIISVMLIGAAFFLGGCATTGVTEQQNSANKADPYENLNRKVLKNINVVINDVLQAKYAQSAHDTGRFALNTTLGLGGFVDVAKSVGLEQNDEDFEQTLAVWGVPQGSYLVIPFLGPSTVRGVPGAAFDTAANPVSYVGLPVQLISLLNTRANAEGALKFIDEAALDPYVITARLNNKMQSISRLPRGNQFLFPCVINQGLQIFSAFNIGSFGPFNQIIGDAVARHINNAP